MGVIGAGSVQQSDQIVDRGQQSITATTGGLANDYADRSTAQAQSVAFRVALLQTFALPTHSPEPEQTGVERAANLLGPVGVAGAAAE